METKLRFGYNSKYLMSLASKAIQNNGEALMLTNKINHLILSLITTLHRIFKVGRASVHH